MAHFEEPKIPGSQDTILDIKTKISPQDRDQLDTDFRTYRANKETVRENKSDSDALLQQVRIELKTDRTKDVPIGGASSNAVVFSPSENLKIHALREASQNKDPKPKGWGDRILSFFNF